MGPGQQRRWRWWWLALGGVVVVALVFVVLLRFVLFQDSTTVVDADEALARYRASTTTSSVATAATSTPATVATTATPATTITPATTVAPVATTAAVALVLPESGVYRYATTGSEHIDAIGGTTHDYPPVTTNTVTPDGCGVQLRWDALEERWNSRQLCLGDGGIVLGTYTDFHRFFGQDDRTDWTCSPPYVVLPSAPGPGASWSGSCTDGSGTQEATTISVVGLEDVDVGGQSVAAVHIQRVENDTASDTTALSTTDQWLDARSALVLREVASSTSTTSSPIGDVHYTEQYELTLMALTPEH